MVIHPETTPDAQQLEIIAQQLGRMPRGIEALAATDGHGTPLVLRMAPIVEDKPFPTLYWLSSELLKIELSRIEAVGVIKLLEARIQEDDDFRRAYHVSHQDYIDRRWRLMSDAQRNDVERLGYTSILRERGIGGIANHDQVRCLHTQYAHHLCGNNVVGQWLDEHYGIMDLLP